MKKKRKTGLFFGVLIFCTLSISQVHGFTDIERNWAKRYIHYFHEKSLIRGGGNSKFYPDSSMKLEDMILLLHSYLNQEQLQFFQFSEMEGSVLEIPESEKKEENVSLMNEVFEETKKSIEERRETFEKENSDDSIEFEIERKSEDLSDETKSVSSVKDEISNEKEGEEAPIYEMKRETTVEMEVSQKEAKIVQEQEAEKKNLSKDAYSGLLSDYHAGLLEEFSLDKNFSNQLLSRNIMYQLLKNYDNILQKEGIVSGRAESYLSMFSDERNGYLSLISPNQVINRSEAMKILFDVFEGGELPFDHIVELNLPYISQVTPVYAPVGCEPISLLMGLRYRGYAKDVSIRTYLDKVPRDKDDPEVAFAGSPYVPNKNLRTTIFPKPLAEYGRRYGADVIDLTGKDTEDLKKELYQGRPVVAYVTLYWKKPYYRTYRIKGEKRTYLRNNHALVLAGYNPVEKKFLVFDPYNVKGIKSKYWVRENTFKELYEVRKHAVSIR